MAFENIEEVSDRHLHILWINGDPVTSEDMVLMYSRNSMLRGWWDKVTVVIWGAPQKLIFENEAVLAKLRIAKLAGVEFTACVACALDLGVKEKLEEEGIEVIPWGVKLTQLIQNGRPLITL
ncbi:MAG: DsrE family protein [Firmicutes bacterium]|nr:DsrE family protein [Bacillota bacterium]